MKNFKKFGFMVAMVLVSSQAFAAVICKEEITTLTVGMDGSVVFSSTNAEFLPVPGNQKAVDRAFMQLTLAMQKKLPVYVNWLGTNVCDKTTLNTPGTQKTPMVFELHSNDIK